MTDSNNAYKNKRERGRVLRRLGPLGLWMGFVAIGLWLSLYKPLWNDEIYSQTWPVQKQSYREMLTGHIREGNNSPLFYIIQKAVCRIGRYRLVMPKEINWYVIDRPGQVLLRLPANLYMSSALTLMVLFFTRWWGWRWGLYALAVMLSSPMVWRYWAEARPYPLWIFLTVAQALLVLSFVSDQEGKARMGLLMGTHGLMAVTSIFSLAQIGIASAVLWLDRRMKGLRLPAGYWVVTVGAMAICLFYYSRAPKYHFWFDPQHPPWRLMFEALPWQYLTIGGLCAGMTFVFNRQEVSATARWYGLFWALTILAAGGLMGLFVLRAEAPPEGFAVVSRYFLFATPVTLIAVVVFSRQAMRAARSSWARFNIGFFLAGLLLSRFFTTYMEIYGQAFYWI